MPTDTSATDREVPRPTPGPRRWLVALAGVLGLLMLSSLPVRSPQFAAATIGSATLELEVARTPDEHRAGLSGRSELPGDGMLFLFTAPQSRVFWMRGMRFPLDIVWVRGDTVVGLTAHVTPPRVGTPDTALERFSSPEPVDRVIELAAGRASSLGIAPGPRYKINFRIPARRPSWREDIWQNIKNLAGIL